MSGWDAHLLSLVGSTDSLGAIFTRQAGEVCSQSPGMQVSPADAAEAATLLTGTGNPPAFFGAKHTIIGQSDAKQGFSPVYTLLKKPAAQSGVGAAVQREFVVVGFTNTLTFVLKVGASDFHTDAADRAANVRDYLVSHGL